MALFKKKKSRFCNFGPKSSRHDSFIFHFVYRFFLSPFFVSIFSRLFLPVWPNVGTKSSQMYPKRAQKVATAVWIKSDIFNNCRISHQYLVYFCHNILYPDLSKITQWGHTGFCFWPLFLSLWQIFSFSLFVQSFQSDQSCSENDGPVLRNIFTSLWKRFLQAQKFEFTSPYRVI